VGKREGSKISAMTCNHINKFTIIYYSDNIKIKEGENLILGWVKF
jgi:hypothetical protein